MDEALKEFLRALGEPETVGEAEQLDLFGAPPNSASTRSRPRSTGC
jgi:hypothetical protein